MNGAIVFGLDGDVAGERAHGHDRIECLVHRRGYGDNTPVARQPEKGPPYDPRHAKLLPAGRHCVQPIACGNVVRMVSAMRRQNHVDVSELYCASPSQQAQGVRLMPGSTAGQAPAADQYHREIPAPLAGDRYRARRARGAAPPPQVGLTNSLAAVPPPSRPTEAGR